MMSVKKYQPVLKPEIRVLKEFYDIEALEKIAKIKDFSFLKDEESEDVSSENKVENTGVYIDQIRTLLKGKDYIVKSYSQNNTNISDIAKGRYYYRNNPKHNAAGLLYLKNSVRGFIVRKGTQDLDISNCHPTLLNILMKTYSVECKELNEYIESREDCMKKYKFTKIEFNAMVNNRRYFGSNKFLAAIHTALYGELIPKLKIDFNSNFIVAQNSKKGNDNAEGVFISNILQEFEQDVMYYVMNYLETHNIQYTTLIYDGIHIYGTLDTNDLTAFIKQSTGHYIKFSIKPFDTSRINKALEAIELHNEYEDDSDDSVVLEDDKMVGLHLFSIYKKKIINNKGTLYAYYKHMWNEDIKEVFEQWLSNCDAVVKCKGKVEKVNAQTSKWPNYVKQLTCICKEKLEPVDVLNKQKDILPFVNGYYDFILKKFIKYEENTIIHTTYKVNRNFPESIDLNILKKVETTMIDIFDDNYDLMDEVFSYFARALSNHREDKAGLCTVGERNSAKGFIISNLNNAFKGVITSAISGDLVHKKNSSESAERRNGFLSDFCENLIVFSEEVDPLNKLDGTLWKSITSGGDEVSYRSAYGLKKKSNIMASYVITCNKTPNFTVSDAFETLLLCNMPCKYVDKLPEDESDYRGFKMKLSDNTIKPTFEKEEYVDAFVHFVLSFYKSTRPLYPITVQMNKENYEITEDYVDSKNTLADAIKNLYDITLNVDDKISCSEVHRMVSKIDASATPQKIKMYLQHNQVNVKRVHINLYVGIRLKEKEEKKVEDYLF